MATWKLKAGVEMQLAPDYEWDFENGREQLILTYHGPYATLAANKPIHGALVAGFGELLRVIHVKLKRAPGEKGILTVTLERDSTGFALDEDFDTPTLELEWLRIEQPIEGHPKFSGIYTEHKEKVGEYFGSATAEERRTIYTELQTIAGESSSGPITSAATSAACALILIDTKLKGADSYVSYAPIVRRTSKASQAATANTCATEVLTAEELESVIGEDVPAGYEYIQTADRSTRSGTASRWERREEWTGAQDIDDIIYPVGAWTA